MKGQAGADAGSHFACRGRYHQASLAASDLVLPPSGAATGYDERLLGALIRPATGQRSMLTSLCSLTATDTKGCNCHRKRR